MCYVYISYWRCTCNCCVSGLVSSYILLYPSYTSLPLLPVIPSPRSDDGVISCLCDPLSASVTTPHDCQQLKAGEIPQYGREPPMLEVAPSGRVQHCGCSAGDARVRCQSLPGMPALSSYEWVIRRVICLNSAELSAWRSCWGGGCHCTPLCFDWRRQSSAHPLQRSGLSTPEWYTTHHAIYLFACHAVLCGAWQGCVYVKFSYWRNHFFVLLFIVFWQQDTCYFKNALRGLVLLWW